jgi:hypothetical protein
MVVTVRPWKEFFAVMITGCVIPRPAAYFLDSLIAASFASAPELQKNAWNNNP